MADRKRVDMTGREVKVGSKIAAAFREDNNAVLRVGVVTGFGSRKDMNHTEPTILVDWSDSSGYGRPRDSWIYEGLRRFVVIDD